MFLFLILSKLRHADAFFCFAGHFYRFITTIGPEETTE